MGEYRLCYVEENKAWFSDDMEKVWGDDWDDRPYECNAGEPYGSKVRAVFYETGYMIEENPCDVGNYSVEEINKGIIPWIKTEDYEIMGGIEYDEFIRVIEEHGGTVYVPRGKDVYERRNG